MEEITANVNWLAVVVGAVLAFALGWFWYSKMAFGPKWAAAHGVDVNDPAMPVEAMVAQAAGTFLLAWVVGVTAAGEALMTFILIILAIAVLVYAGNLFARKGGEVALIDAGYIVAMGVILFVVQAVF